MSSVEPSDAGESSSDEVGNAEDDIRQQDDNLHSFQHYDTRRHAKEDEEQDSEPEPPHLRPCPHRKDQDRSDPRQRQRRARQHQKAEEHHRRQKREKSRMKTAFDKEVEQIRGLRSGVETARRQQQQQTTAQDVIDNLAWKDEWEEDDDEVPNARTNDRQTWLQECPVSAWDLWWSRIVSPDWRYRH